MQKKNYRESLTRLQVAIKSASFKEHGHSQAAMELNDNVKVILEHPGEAPFAHHYQLMSRLQDAVTRFEASHPALTASVSSVIDALNKMGI